MSRMTARDFMQMMHDQLGVRRLVIGYDNRFGHNRDEGFDNYVCHGRDIGIEVVLASELPATGTSISSSQIRKKLKSGNIRQANLELGYRYTFSGIVVQDRKSVV